MRKRLAPIAKYALLACLLVIFLTSDQVDTDREPITLTAELSTEQEVKTLFSTPRPVIDIVDSTETVFGIRDIWSGDFDGMVERRKIRVLVPYNKNFFFLDGSQGKGLTHEAMEIFEKYLRKRTGVRISTVIIPVRRDQLLEALEAGVGDVAAAYLTITPARRKRVDFTAPVYTGAKEWIVTGPGSPKIQDFAGLAGQKVYVRQSSSFYEHLTDLNHEFLEDGRDPIQIETVDEYMEDEDILELIHSGYLPATVVEDNIGRFWSEVFEKIELREDLPIDSDGQIAWAIRKDSPGFKKQLDAFIAENKKGTLMGNVLFNRYLRDTSFMNSISDLELERFNTTVAYFKKYAAQYDLDWLMTIAQGYQESRLDQNTRSHMGAIGVMQVRPATAADRNINIPDVYDLESNIHAGIKYDRFILDHYFAGAQLDELNKHLFALASYNAGPGRIAGMRRLARQQGKDPNVWFNHVEHTVAGEIGLEPVQYVSNIYKYYLSLCFINQFLEDKAKKSKP